MARRRHIRQVKTTLIVVEGFADKAFVEHLKNLYNTRGCGVRVKIKNAKGKGSNNVVRQAINEQAAYDSRAAFYDSDIPLTQTLRRRSDQKNISRIESTPCLEGLLLTILGHRVPRSSEECKRDFAAILGGADQCKKESYGMFDRAILEARRRTLRELDLLLRMLEGN